MEYGEIYLKSRKYAKSCDELTRYEASKGGLIACKDAMERLTMSRDALSEETCAKRRKGLLDRYGSKRCAFVLAATVRGNSGFVEYPRHIVQWANSMPLSEDANVNSAVHVDRAGAAFVVPFVKEIQKRRKEERRSRGDDKGGK